MLNAKDMDLIQRAIDGRLEPIEDVRLAGLLKRNPEARALHATLSAAVEALAHDIPPEPPHDLAARVTQRLAAADPGRASSSPAPARAKAAPAQATRRTVVKYSYVVLAAAAMIALVILGPRLFRSGSHGVTSGTVAPTQAEAAAPMSQMDLRLREVVMRDSATLHQYQRSIGLFRSFVQALHHDMGLWTRDIAVLDSSVRMKVQRGGFTIQDKLDELHAFAAFIDDSGAAVTRLALAIDAMAKGDTAGRVLPLEKAFTEFERFRPAFAEKFRQMMKGVPEMHNNLVRNGFPAGLCARAENALVFASQARLGTSVMNTVIGVGFYFYGKTSIGCFFDTWKNKPQAGSLLPIDHEGYYGSLTIGLSVTFQGAPTTPLGSALTPTTTFGTQAMKERISGLIAR